jgi:hypothetical protein
MYLKFRLNLTGPIDQAPFGLLVDNIPELS